MATDLKALNDYLAKCFLNRAKFLADRGIPVVWAAPRTKRSTLEDWPNRATTQIEVLAEWNRQSPSRNTAAVSKDEFSCAFDIDHPSIMPQLEKETGEIKIRGLLCQFCNQGLGRFQDSSKLLRNAADYLDRNA